MGYFNVEVLKGLMMEVKWILVKESGYYLDPYFETIYIP